MVIATYPYWHWHNGYQPWYSNSFTQLQSLAQNTPMTGQGVLQAFNAAKALTEAEHQH